MLSNEENLKVSKENDVYWNQILNDSKFYFKINPQNKKYEIDNNESITPTTDKGYLDFNLVSKKLEQLKLTESEESIKYFQSLEKQGMFVKKYQYKDSEISDVIRFGINTKKEGLVEDLLIYNKNIRDNLSGNFLEKMSNISGESNYGKFIKAVQPTDIEKNIVNNAIQHLKDTNSKTILVDVFPRTLKQTESNKVGTIDLTKGVESHTALLYNNGTNILIIDPNNPQFSAFLQNINPCIQSSYRADDKIYTRHGESGPDLWRDCIDIAVKLAFVLNHSKENYKDIKSIIESKYVKSLSNNDLLDNDIFYSEFVPIRKKQTSNLEDVFSFSKDLFISRNTYDDTISILKQYVSLNMLSKLADKLKKGFFENLYSNKILPKDKTLSEYIINCKLSNIEKVETDLSGAIDEYFQKCEESHE